MMSVFGATGAAAYFGLLDIGQIREGETVVVSAAGGATGSIAGQIAKIHGCRVVGIAGTDEKCAWVVDELGFDGCINHRTADLARELAELCPDRVDVYFDNVGGPILDAVLGRLNQHGRVVLCGAISTYNDQGRPPGPANYLNLISRRGPHGGVHHARLLGPLRRVLRAAARVGGRGAAHLARAAVRRPRLGPRGAQRPVHRGQHRQGDRPGRPGRRARVSRPST